MESITLILVDFYYIISYFVLSQIPLLSAFEQFQNFSCVTSCVVSCVVKKIKCPLFRFWSVIYYWKIYKKFLLYYQQMTSRLLYIVKCYVNLTTKGDLVALNLTFCNMILKLRRCDYGKAW